MASCVAVLRVLAVAGCGSRARRRVTTRVASLAVSPQDCTALEDTRRLHNMAHTPHGQVHDTTYYVRINQNQNNNKLKKEGARGVHLLYHTIPYRTMVVATVGTTVCSPCLTTPCHTILPYHTIPSYHTIPCCPANSTLQQRLFHIARVLEERPALAQRTAATKHVCRRTNKANTMSNQRTGVSCLEKGFLALRCAGTFIPARTQTHTEADV